ncbi:hypothetical protein OAF54_02740 [bacterium]|nr:hypothetical protein [bacterium]
MIMQEMRTDLAAWLTSLLQAHDADFRVGTKEQKALEQNQSRKERIKVMGNPSKYCHILDMGQASLPQQDGSHDAAGNIDCFIGQAFNVKLFYEKDYINSQDIFETIVYGDRNESIPGVLDSIRESRSRIVSGEEYSIGLPGRDAFASISRGTWDFGVQGGKPELYHIVEFEVILIS